MKYEDYKNLNMHHNIKVTTTLLLTNLSIRFNFNERRFSSPETVIGNVSSGLTLTSQNGLIMI